MNRQNLFSSEWDGENEGDRTQHRVFERPDEARMGATLYELAGGAPEGRIHMHFGAEEMFFVLSGRPVFRNLEWHGGVGSRRLRLLPRGACGPSRVQQPLGRARPDPRDQCRGVPGCRRLPGARVCLGGDPRSRSRSPRERRRPRHHRSLRDPDRVTTDRFDQRHDRRGRASGLFGWSARGCSPTCLPQAATVLSPW